MSNTSLPPSSESDGELLQRVTSSLARQNYGAHHTLRIDVRDGVVRVCGRVPSFYMRQVAVECIRRVPGVSRLEDHMEVAEALESCPPGAIDGGPEDGAY